jgi:hypothetical protein
MLAVAADMPVSVWFLDTPGVGNGAATSRRRAANSGG